MLKTLDVVRGTIDLSGVSGYCEGEEDQIIRERLSGSGLLDEGLLYTIFDHKKLNRLLRTGATTSESLTDGIMYAFSLGEFVWNGNSSGPVNKNIPSRLARDYFPPGLAVFDRSLLVPGHERVTSNYGYVFRNPEDKLGALRGAFKINLNDFF